MDNNAGLLSAAKIFLYLSSNKCSYHSETIFVRFASLLEVLHKISVQLNLHHAVIYDAKH